MTSITVLECYILCTLPGLKKREQVLVEQRFFWCKRKEFPRICLKNL